jgi:hypothetical protein
MGQQDQHRSSQGKHIQTLHPHFIVEFADHLEKSLEGSGKAATQIAKSSAVRAFRATVIEAGSHIPHPVTNSSGNLRGMVLSKRFHTIYHVSSNVAEKFEKYDRALAFASIIIEIGKEADNVHHVFKSNFSKGEKLRQTDLIVSTAILRAVTGVVPEAAHWIAKSLEGYCELGSLVSGGKLKTEGWVGALRSTDVLIKTTHEKLFSPEFIQHLGDSAADVVFAHVHFN